MEVEMNKVGMEYFRIFNSPAGAMVLEDLKKKVSLVEPMLPDFNNPNKIFYVEGRRDLVREIIATVEYFKENKE
jgi:hypothetical protein